MDITLWLLFLGIVTLVAAVAGAIGAWRTKATAHQLSEEHLERRLDRSEGRVLEQINRLREGVASTLREGTEASGKAQRGLAVELRAGLDETQTQALKSIVDRFEAIRSDLSEVLAVARKSQDERLDKVEAAFNSFTATFQQATGELKTSLLEAAKTQGDAQAKSAGELREAVTKRLGDSQATLGDQFRLVQKELAETLGTSRESQEQRLGKVEGSLVQFGKDFKQEVGELKASLLRETKAQSDALTKSLGDLTERLAGAQAEARKEQATGLLAQKASLDQAREAQTKSLGEMQGALTADFGKLRDAQTKAFSELQDHVQSRLDAVRKDNEEKLEKIRTTVEEKLQSTLEARLGESFRQVSDRLEQVYKGLGEMRTLATGVGDLKRVLTNVRSRGTFGEVQLSALLEQVLTPEQYGTNVVTVPGSSERVEFAIKLPGRDDDGSSLFLPIDAKFPQEDYQRLQQAYEDGDSQAVEETKKALRQRVLLEAKTIHEKYIAPPHTTDFALLFLPTEGLYAEILRIPGLFEEVQRLHRVVPVGPTNLQAFLNSLQMGFRTLTIEKRSSEVWKVLAAVKTEFAKFGESLDAVGKKLQEAGNKIEDTARRSRAVERKLRQVEALPVDEAARILPAVEVGPMDDDGGLQE